MATVKVESKSRRVRAYVTAVLARNRARLVLTAAEAQVQVRLAELTGGQLGEAKRLLEDMTQNGGT